MIKLKKYFQRRKDAITIYQYRELGDLILMSVGKLLRKNNEQKTGYFIKKCQDLQKWTINNYENHQIKVSENTIEEIRNLDLSDLHDCEKFGHRLHDVFRENRNNSPSTGPFLPIFIHGTPIAMIEFIPVVFVIGGILLFI